MAGPTNPRVSIPHGASLALGDYAEKLNKAITAQMMTPAEADEFMHRFQLEQEGYMTGFKSPMPSSNAAMQAAPNTWEEKAKAIFGQARVGGFSEANNGYAGSQISRTMCTPADWLQEHAKAIEALKEVMEYLAAQDNMDPWATKPLQKQIYQRIIREGMTSLMGAR